MASNPLLKFRDEILEKVIYPKLYGILYSEKGNLSPAELWKEFREKHDCSVSLREFKEWLVSMNLEQQQVTTWNINAPQQPEQMNYRAVKEEPFIPTDEDIDEVLFDNE